MRWIILIFVVLLSITTVSAQNRSATLQQTTNDVVGETFKDIYFDASDTINEGETYYVEITCKKHYQQTQDVYVAGSAVSGSGDVVITVYGKKFSDDDYASIATSTWDSSSDLDEVISNTTANAYRYYKVEFVSDATEKQVLVTDVKFKTWLTNGDLSSSSLSLSGNLSVTGTSTLDDVITLENGLTIDNSTDTKLEFNENSDELIWTFGSNEVAVSSGDVTSFDYGTIDLGTDALDLSEGNITNVGEIAVDLVDDDDGAIAIGDGDETVAVNSSDWDIDATGVATGLGNITSDGTITSADVKTTGNVGTADSTTVTAVEYGDGFHHVTVLTLTDFVIGTPSAGNDLAFGSTLYTFPAGVHVHSITYSNIGLTAGTQQDDTPDIGIGSVVASGASATLNGSTNEDYITGQTWGSTLDGTAEVDGPTGATAGVLTGISLNGASDSKKVILNAADGWHASITGDLTASGTVILIWDFLE